MKYISLPTGKLVTVFGLLSGDVIVTYCFVKTFTVLIVGQLEAEDKFKNLGYCEFLSSLKKELENYISILRSNQDSILKTKNVSLVNCYKVYVV